MRHDHGGVPASAQLWRPSSAGFANRSGKRLPKRWQTSHPEDRRSPSRTTAEHTPGRVTTFADNTAAWCGAFFTTRAWRCAFTISNTAPFRFLRADAATSVGVTAHGALIEFELTW